MSSRPLERGVVETARHRTSYLAAGPTDGPLMIFLHGAPDLSIFWRHQLEFFGDRGWRCIAPDMRGLGESAVPTSIAAYSVREIVRDMIELHDALGGRPAVWVGHDWGGAFAWSMAAQHRDRCRAVVNLSTPYLARGFAVSTMVPLVDRDLYPEDQFPVGQWDYLLFYKENFARAAADFEADVTSTFAALLRAAPPIDLSAPAISASVRRQGGWFGDLRRAPPMPRDETIMNDDDFATIVAAYERTGFSGAIAMYLNDTDNLAYAAEAPNFGRVTVPSLYIHAGQDPICNTVRGRMAEPMRADVDDLTEVVIETGHLTMLERPDETNKAIANWLMERDKRQA
jgi:pimeloyl-ACP methyl ester carboxylesterase